ncbi:hypothetical protein ACFL30_00880 [Candidatus Latescibacterota bacterium]
MKVIKRFTLFVLIFSLIACISNTRLVIADPNANRIKPYSENPRYWQYKGKPVLLIGGTKDDSLFQIPDLEEHLDLLADCGGNYIRNTMSSRQDKGFELYPFKRLDNGKWDLNKWDEAYWARFETMLKLTSERDIIVQIEVWDRFDYARNNWNDGNPYNPKYNVNYTSEESGLKHEINTHPGRNENRFFYTVPALDNNRLILDYQKAQINRLLDISLQYGNVLYCMDNETNGSPEWGKFWSQFIKDKAAESGVEVHTTEMWDKWDIRHDEHKSTYDHPELYSFIDVSQNNHNKGQKHWDNLMWVREYISGALRPMNTIKIYGADTGKYGTTTDGRERFWRNIFGGCATTRFHRPGSGIGLSSIARANIRSMRMLSKEIDFFSSIPDSDSSSLYGRVDNEAYLTFIAGSHYAVYFPDGGSVTLDLSQNPSAADREWNIRWLNIIESEWQDTSMVFGNKIVLAPPRLGHWVALVTK